MELRIHRVILIASFGIATVAGVASIDWHTVDGGGSIFMTGGNAKLAGTVGQCDAGTMTGGGFALTGGFWAAPATASIPGDCDGDGDVDLSDYSGCADCFLGPFGGIGVDCNCCDVDLDGDVDLADFSAVQAVIPGP